MNKICISLTRHGMDDGPSLPVVQVNNQSPFRVKSQTYVAVNSSKGLKVFELFSIGNKGIKNRNINIRILN